jgi:hypothetical protein
MPRDQNARPPPLQIEMAGLEMAGQFGENLRKAGHTIITLCTMSVLCQLYGPKNLLKEGD